MAASEALTSEAEGVRVESWEGDGPFETVAQLLSLPLLEELSDAVEHCDPDEEAMIE